MVRELVSISLNLQYEDGVIDPADLTEDNLQTHSLIDEENQIDYSQLRNGMIGTNYVFNNDAKEQIQIHRTKLEIKASSTERFYKMFDLLKEKYGNAYIDSGVLTTNEHFVDPSFPEAVLDRYTNTSGMKLEVARVVKENFQYTFYNCRENHIHLMGQSSLIEPKLFEDMEVESDFKVKNEFVKYDLKINI